MFVIYSVFAQLDSNIFYDRGTNVYVLNKRCKEYTVSFLICYPLKNVIIYDKVVRRIINSNDRRVCTDAKSEECLRTERTGYTLHLRTTHFLFYKQLDFQFQPGVAYAFFRNEPESCLVVA